MPELRHRFRKGYLGFESLSYANRFRNLRIQELPATDRWQTLYSGPEDFDNWYISEGKPKFQTLGEVIHADGAGHLATKEKFRDFELQLYVRHIKHHNSGILFRTSGQGLTAATTRFNSTMWKARTIPPARSIASSALFIRRSSPRSGFRSSSSPMGKTVSCASMVTRCSNTISSKFWMKAILSCRPMLQACGRSSRTFALSGSGLI